MEIQKERDRETYGERLKGRQIKKRERHKKKEKAIQLRTIHVQNSLPNNFQLEQPITQESAVHSVPAGTATGLAISKFNYNFKLWKNFCTSRI